MSQAAREDLLSAIREDRESVAKQIASAVSEERERWARLTGEASYLTDSVIPALREEIERLMASRDRLKSAIEFAHSEGFQWPSDPMAEFADVQQGEPKP